MSGQNNETTALEYILQETSRRALTTIRAILETGVIMGLFLTNVNAKLDRHGCRVREPFGCESAK